MTAIKMLNRLQITTLIGIVICVFILTAAVPAPSWDTWQKEGDNAILTGQYGDAERAFKAAVKEAEKPGVSKRKLAKSLKSLANLYAIRSKDAEAAQLLARSLQLRKDIDGHEHADVIASQKVLAVKYLAKNKLKEADKLAGDLLSLADAKISDHKSIKASFDNLARFYGSHRDFTQAELHVDRARELTCKGMADQHLELAAALDALGQKYKGMGNLARAEAFFERGLYLRESALAPEHRALVHSLDNLASVYMAEKKYAKAEQLYKRSLKLVDRAPGKPNPTDLACHLEYLGRCYQNEGKGSSAETYFKKALTTLRDSYGNKNQQVGNSSYMLACLYLDQSRYSEAEPLLRQALSISENANGPEHISLAPILDKYASVLDKTNRSGPASRLRARARKLGG